MQSRASIRCRGDGYFLVPVVRNGHLDLPLFIRSVLLSCGGNLTLGCDVVVGRDWFGIRSVSFCIKSMSLV